MRHQARLGAPGAERRATHGLLGRAADEAGASALPAAHLAFARRARTVAWHVVAAAARARWRRLRTRRRGSSIGVRAEAAVRSRAAFVAVGVTGRVAAREPDVGYRLARRERAPSHHGERTVPQRAP